MFQLQKAKYFYNSGNLYVTPEGQLCLIDFGLCAEVDSKSRYSMTSAIVHLITGDFDSLINNDAKDLGFLPTGKYLFCALSVMASCPYIKGPNIINDF